MGDAVDDDKFARDIQEVLTENTPDGLNSGHMAKKLFNCRIVSQQHLDTLVGKLASRAATAEQQYIQAYAEVCSELRSAFAKAKPDTICEADFKRALLTECQGSIERLLQEPPERDSRKTAHKAVLLGYCRFLAALIVKKIVPSAVIVAVSDELLAEPSSPDKLEALVSFLT